MSTSEQTNRVQVKRLIKASPERVFAAWTCPDQLRHWFGSGECRILNVQIDPRVGGVFLFSFASESGDEMTVRGEYREVTSPSKLVFTWRWQDDSDWEKVDSVVAVDFIPQDGGTEVVITHDGFPTSESAGNHDHGWTGGLDRLAARTLLMGEFFGPGRFSWSELLATNLESTSAFYKDLLGWEAVPVNHGMPYTLFKKNGSEVAGLLQMPKPGVPSHWVSYITVDEVDPAVERLLKLGGSVCVQAFDIPHVGRIAVVQDPEGAKFGLFRPL